MSFADLTNQNGFGLQSARIALAAGALAERRGQKGAVIFNGVVGRCACVRWLELLHWHAGPNERASEREQLRFRFSVGLRC